MAFSKQSRRNKIRRRIRATIFGTSSKPRLSVFRSNKSIYVQIIDDVSGSTLVSASSKDLSGTKIDQANLVGKSIAEKAIAAGDNSWGTAVKIAVNLYLDIINLFIDLLEILASSD